MSLYKRLEKPRTPSRRKCGWGSVVTNCVRCGRAMIGHNRGVCSKCLRQERGATGTLYHACGNVPLSRRDAHRAARDNFFEITATGGAI